MLCIFSHHKVCAARLLAFLFSGFPFVMFFQAWACLSCVQVSSWSPWEKDKLSGFAEVEDREPAALGAPEAATASRVEVLLAPCASSFW